MANLVEIENYLKKRGINYKVIDLGGEVFKVDEVIKSGVNPKEIVKTLIVRTQTAPAYSSSPSIVILSGAKNLGVNSSREVSDKIIVDSKVSSRQARTISFVALAVRGQDRVDFKKVRRLFGNKSELAKPEEVEKIVGVPVGVVCPVLVGIPLIFDQRVMGLAHVNLGSGDLTKGLEMDLGDLLKAVGEYKVEDLV